MNEPEPESGKIPQTDRPGRSAVTGSWSRYGRARVEDPERRDVSMFSARPEIACGVTLIGSP